MDLDVDGALARGLRRYVALVAGALGLSGPGWTVQLDPPASAYLPLDQRLPAFPGRDTALLWHELHGWALAVETARGQDLQVVAYQGLDVLPTPRGVAQFATRLLRATAAPAGPASPPHLRALDDDVLADRLAVYTGQSPTPRVAVPLTTRLESRGCATVLHVIGEVDMITEAVLLEAATEALAGRPPVLVIDLTDVTFLASAGLHVLIETHLAARDTSVRVVAASRCTQQPLHVTGLDTQLDIYPTLHDALSDTVSEPRASTS
ncbi:DUF6292 family protein [Actinophytocola sp.]|uniref:DUF6292 family protein n=1 Tax=Actinophytocola sp. TaxID=1872138 RepID=UPI002D7F7659|nr:DUF6292 family protein [Actinophytocola sp.]HET9140879.1 DUF6292 family protein [Actinophytocola sp.]